MLINELSVENKGLFEYMHGIRPLFFETPFSIKSLDLGFYVKHGTRQIANSITPLLGSQVNDEFMTTLANLIIELYYKKWSTLYDLMVKNLQLTQNDYKMFVLELTTDDGQNTGTINKENNSTKTGKVSAYDSEEFSNKDQKIENFNEANQATETKKNNRKMERHVEGNVKHPTKNLNEAIDYLRKNLVYDIIYNDIVNTIALHIY